MRRPSVIIVLAIVTCFSLSPVALACSYVCETGCDQTQTSCHAHCYEMLTGSGSMADCTERQTCYRYANGGWFCDFPRCEGTPCYQV
jgi:hypothetical protein